MGRPRDSANPSQAYFLSINQLLKELALELEEETQHLGDREDDLAVGDIEEERLPHPLAPLAPGGVMPLCRPGASLLFSGRGGDGA